MGKANDKKVYEFQRVFGDLYAIYVEDKAYGLLLEPMIPDIKSKRVHVYLMDENEKVICEVSRPFGLMFRSFRQGIDEVGNMLQELADITKKVNIDFSETFKEIRKEMSQNRAGR